MPLHKNKPKNSAPTPLYILLQYGLGFISDTVYYVINLLERQGDNGAIVNKPTNEGNDERTSEQTHRQMEDSVRESLDGPLYEALKEQVG